MSQMTKSIETVVLMVVAVAIIVMDKEMFFSREHLVEEGVTAQPALQRA